MDQNWVNDFLEKHCPPWLSEQIEADRAEEAHKSAINAIIISAMIAIGIDEGVAMKMVYAIEVGKIPHIQILY